MLRANAHYLSDVRNIFLLLLGTNSFIISDHMPPKACDPATCGFEHACHDGDAGGLACSVVA